MTKRLDRTAPDLVLIANAGDEVPLVWNTSADLSTGYDLEATWRPTKGGVQTLVVTGSPTQVATTLPAASSGTLLLVQHQNNQHRRTLTTVKVETK